MRILLVSQMYPGPEDPDLGIFVANLERELTARGHEIARAVIDRRVSEPDDFADENLADLAVLVGVWANRTRVHRGRDEFTVDFIRDVPERSRSVLVARAVVSPVVGLELRDQLDEVWRHYYEWSMPKDTNDG